MAYQQPDWLWKGLKNKMVEVGSEVHYVLFPVYTHRLIDKERPIFGLHKLLTSRGSFLKWTWTLELLVLAFSTRLTCKVKCREFLLLYRPSKMPALTDEHLNFLLSPACTRWNHCRCQHAWEIQVYENNHKQSGHDNAGLSMPHENSRLFVCWGWWPEHFWGPWWILHH